MRIDFLQEAEAIAPELRAQREAIHRCPELGNHEYETAKRVEAFLRACGVETERLLDTAVVGTLRGALPGPTVGLRADMDALPVTEATGAPFASENPGKMHACGHDVHTTGVLGAAKLLSAHRDSLAGTVKFFFQPDEEGSGGAQRMIDAGCMGDTAAVFGCHMDPGLPLGTVGIRYGKFYAASDNFIVTVHGKSVHGAQREKGIDALAAAAEMVTGLVALPSTLLPERSVVTVGCLHAGTADNVLAGEAEFRGIVRTLGPDSREAMRQRVRQTIESIAAKFGAAVDLRQRVSYAGVVNTDPETALAREAAEALLGKDRVRVLEEPTMTSEDFGCFIDASSGCFYHVGAGCPVPLHAPTFLPDPQAPVIAAATHAAVVWAYLNR